MNPETVTALLNLIRFGAESIESLQSGKKSEEQVWKEYEEMQNNVRAASARWRSGPQG